MKNFRLVCLGHTERMHRSEQTCFQCLDRIELVVSGSSWTSQVVNRIDLQFNWFGDVVEYELEVVKLQQVLDRLFPACKEIVKANHMLPAVNQPLTEVGPKKTRTTSN